MKNLKRILCIGLTTALALPMFACSANGSSSSAAKSSKEITVAVPQTVGISSTVKSLVKGFTAKNKDIKVNIQEVVADSSSLYSKMDMLMTTPQTCPDLICEDGFMVDSDALAGYLQPLDSRIKGYSDWSQFNKPLRDSVAAENGKTYAVPIYTDVQGIWYNKVLFKEAGISVPWQPKTWDDILSAAKKLKAMNKPDLIPMYVYASKADPEETSMRTFQLLMSGTGGKIYDYSTKKWIVDKANITKTLDFVNNVYNVDKVGAPLSLVSQANVESTLQSDQMKNGKLGILLSGSWVCQNWANGATYAWPDAMKTWAFAKTPTCDGKAPKYTSMSGGWTWAIPKNSKNKDAAWKFVKYMSSKDTMLKFDTTTKELTVRTDIASNSKFQSVPFSVNKTSGEILNYTHFRPSVGKYPSVSILLTQTVESVAMNKMTPAQAVNAYEESLIRLVGKDNVVEK